MKLENENGFVEMDSMSKRRFEVGQVYATRAKLMHDDMIPGEKLPLTETKIDPPVGKVPGFCFWMPVAHGITETAVVTVWVLVSKLQQQQVATPAMPAVPQG